jgi:hypothetical protein
VLLLALVVTGIAVAYLLTGRRAIQAKTASS